MLYEGMGTAYIRESVFVGTQTGLIDGILTAKMSYSVGYATHLTDSAGVQKTKYGSTEKMGILLPTLREETCLQVPASPAA